jgi:outer membrane protein OmpA-like peptidoglycan-associated protein
MPLFQSLQQSTTARETVQVRDAYVQANRLGTLVARIYFGDGDAQPDSKADAAMRKAMEAVAPGSYLLAVGYASVKGNAIYNENLSSLRAQTVVSRVRPLIKGGKVQMVYFGETTQFDSRDLSKNRVVELWRIDN